MKTLLNRTEVIAKVNELIQAGKKLQVFKLPYPPYHEPLKYSDPKNTRVGTVLTESDVSHYIEEVATKIKIHTITGWTSIFKYEGDGKYSLAFDKEKNWVVLNLLDPEVCEGMILHLRSQAQEIEIVGTIININTLEVKKGESVSEYLKITTLNHKLTTDEILIDLGDETSVKHIQEKSAQVYDIAF